MPTNTPIMKNQTVKTPSVYIPTTSPTPVFGQSGDSVKALQQSLNQKYAGVAGYTPLVIDGKYGSLTEPAMAKENTVKGAGLNRIIL